MPNKVVLIQPRNTLLQNIYPPLNLVQIGSAIEARGYKAKIIISALERDPIRAVLEECKDASFVGMGILTPEIPDAIEIAKRIKEHYKLPIVWGGWHATLFPEQMAESDLVDAVIDGEGDDAIVRIIDDIEKGKNYLGAGEVVRVVEKPKMDLLPFPDYSLVDEIEFYINTKLADKFLEYETRKIRWLPYQASRGCPGKCAFCINVVTKNRQWRCKNVEKVIDEIEKIVNKYKLNHLKIIDDNFFVNTKWVQEIALKLIDKQLNITWDAECRADYIHDFKVNDELLDLCVRAGLNELNFGIESGSQDSLDRMKKGVSPEQNYFAVKKASEHGIVCRCSFILDIPGDSKEDILKTISLINKIRKLPKITCGVHTYRPYPKSELCEGLLNNGKIRQPINFEEWAEQEYIEQFTYSSAKRIWQNNYKLTNKVSFYQNLESGFWLKPHQIKSKPIRALNSLFMKIAYLRNRKLFFNLSIDRRLYNLFKRSYFKFSRYREKS